MGFLKIIEEGRVDDFSSKYRTKFSQEQLKRIIDSVSPKYLMWVGKTFDGINFENSFNRLNTTLKKFEKISSNLPKTDISQYKNLDELESSISEYENRNRREFKQVKGGNLVYDDGRLYVVNPLEHSASCYYGRGTKWCTAADSDYQFVKYNEDGKLFYILDRTRPTSDPLYKVALLRKFNGDKIYYNAEDDVIKTGWIFNTEEINKLENKIDEYLSKEFAEQIKIFSDIEMAKKEKERLRNLEKQRILNQRKSEAEERRLDDEWNLDDPNIDEIGLKAHALFEWLVDNREIVPLTDEDKIEIQRIKNRIEELELEYEETEGDGVDILNEIQELQDELEEFEDKLDVYGIIPTDVFYSTTYFKVLTPNLYDNGYAVGTEDEMQISCEESIENLIDDIGYEGFNRSFVINFLDDDAIVSYAEEFYEDVVRDSPDSYLDEDTRELSYNQEEKIEILQNKIYQAENTIEELEDNLGDDEEQDEEISEKIDYLRDLIVEYEDEIEEIQNNPEGDFPEDMIEAQIRDLVDDVRRDPEWFLNDMGMEWSEFINKDEFIEGVIDADGYGHTLNGYDGNADEIYVNNDLFYVMRVD